MRIGVFDSGIGGLTVLKELVRKYPNNEYIYVGDNLNVPYGEKNKNELFSLSAKIIDYLLLKKIDIIIIACGTVSSNIKDELIRKYSIPIIDIITPTISYIKENRYKKIGILATHMTIKSKVFENNLENIETLCTEAPKLVPAIENNNINDINECLSLYLNKYLDQDIDLLVLGCTHYPIIEDYIRGYLSNKVKILNMAIPILNNIKLTNESKKSVVINFTELNNDIINNTKRILCDIDYVIKSIAL